MPNQGADNFQEKVVYYFFMVREMKLKELLVELKVGLQAIYESRLKGLYLYGSYARGEQEKDSDVDVLVVLDHFDRYFAEVERSGKLASDLSLKYGVSVSRVFMREFEWLHEETPFLLNVREEAIAT